MERPSFITTLKQAHRFTIQNFWTFLPLALKTCLLVFILFIVVCGGFIGITWLLGLNDFSRFLTDQDPTLLTPLTAVLWGIFIVVGLGGIGLALCPWYVSLFRRALLDEDIDRKYLKRIFARRELNLFVAQLKMMSVFGGVIIIAGAVGIVLYGLVEFVQSQLVTIIVICIGIVGGIGFTGWLIFLYARFLFVVPNVVLDRGSNLKTSIQQSRSYTFFLLGISISLSILLEILKNFLQLTVGMFVTEGILLIVVSILFIIINLLLSYYLMIIIPAAISFTYKTIVLKEGLKEEQQVIPPLT